jgi:hypothetical protein
MRPQPRGVLTLVVRMLPSINEKHRPIVKPNGKPGIVIERDFRREMAKACEEVGYQIYHVGWEVAKDDCYVIFATLPFFLWPEEQPWGRKRDEDNYWKALCDELVRGRALFDDSLVAAKWTQIRFEYDPHKLSADIVIFRFAQADLTELPTMRQIFDDWLKSGDNRP